MRSLLRHSREYVVVCASTILALACSSKADPAGPSGCAEGSEQCACYPNDTCDKGLSCRSNMCVDLGDGAGGKGGLPAAEGGADSDPAGGGKSGEGGRASKGGRASTEPSTEPQAGNEPHEEPGSGGGGSSGQSGSPRGGSPATPQGGQTPQGGGQSSQGGSTSSPQGGSTSNPQGGTTSVSQGGSSAGPRDEVSDERILDNFSSCDRFISRVAGRDGGWFTFGDNDVNLTPNTSGSAPLPAASSPPSQFSDHSCAAWVTGGCAETADSCAYAGIGFVLRSDGGGYDLSDFEGLQFDYEGGDLWVVVTGAQGRSFGTGIMASNGSRRTRSFAFSELVPSGETPKDAVLDLRGVKQIDFTTITPSGFGLAIWDIRLF
ncbi:MAG TPA: hypothetical protein VFQ61_19760 [Polyangiaceae bacterium]|nr:hypothetical protein [Polyangiaceae bacterium]